MKRSVYHFHLPRYLIHHDHAPSLRNPKIQEAFPNLNQTNSINIHQYVCLETVHKTRLEVTRIHIYCGYDSYVFLFNELKRFLE